MRTQYGNILRVRRLYFSHESLESGQECVGGKYRGATGKKPNPHVASANSYDTSHISPQKYIFHKTELPRHIFKT